MKPGWIRRVCALIVCAALCAPLSALAWTTYRFPTQGGKVETVLDGVNILLEEQGLSNAVYSPVRGKVVGVWTMSAPLWGLGNALAVQAEDGGNVFLFSHLSAINVGEGAEVEEGTLIGRAGRSGTKSSRMTPCVHIKVFSSKRAMKAYSRDYRDTEGMYSGETVRRMFSSFMKPAPVTSQDSGENAKDQGGSV